jgi:phytoene desaturase
LSKHALVIGSGFAGLSAACCLAREGVQVTLLEKNATAGGRARQLNEAGFTFDMGPSWYWMPEIFDEFFGLFGKKASDYYTLDRLDPGYRIYFGENDIVDVPASLDELYALFERIEPGSSPKLRKFLADAEFKYVTGMREFVHKPALSPMEFMDLRILKAGLKMQLLTSVSAEVRSLFRDSRLVRMLEFPVLFLGATPQNTPALYTMMNYADLVLGTWYPRGGMHEVVKAMVSLARELGVRIELNTEVDRLEVDGRRIKAVHTADGRVFTPDVVVSGADYHHTEQNLLPAPYRRYSESYWAKRTMAPSSLLFYVGLDKKLSGVVHHTLFFDRDFGQHAEEIYTTKTWPSAPLFYTSITSVSDPDVAPAGHENLVMLIPIATDLEDTPEIRERYFDEIIGRMELLTGQSIRPHVVYKRSYCIRDFKADYHSFGGNAYGLANTLLQTAFLKPKMRSTKVDNLYFTGQLTVPGPGVPPALISGQIAAREVMKRHV